MKTNNATNNSPESGFSKVEVWDLLIRIFHWSLVFFFSIAYITENDWLEVHSYAGYTVFLLLIFRIFWGFFGTTFAKFKSFQPNPKTAIRFLKDEATGKVTRHYLGHNPAGAIMVYIMITVLLLTTLSGMALVSTEGYGPLANTFTSSWSGNTLEEIHEFLTETTLILVMLHIAGVIFSSFMQNENIVKSMITGTKENKKGDKHD